MSFKKAQTIVNQVEDKLGIVLTSYEHSELVYLRNQLNKFLELEVAPEDLDDPSESDLDDDVQEHDEYEDYDRDQYDYSDEEDLSDEDF